MKNESHEQGQPTPKQQLYILHLEDDPYDRELVSRALQAGGFECEFVYAAGHDDFRAALLQRKYDLILSDYTLPGYNGSAALDLAQQLQPGSPFLFVSGTIGEEGAIDSLKRGATDYVLKHKLDRLLPSVERALRESEECERRQQAEDALRQSEERLRTMAETIRDIFWLSGPAKQQFVYVSPAYETTWGRSLASLYADPQSWQDAIVPEDRPLVRAALERLAQGADFRVEYRINRPDGAVRWIEERGYAIRNEHGEVERTTGVATDITERKQLESQLLHSQKMEALGQLAGGVAHDFNNLLTVMTGNTSLLLETEELSPDAQDCLKQVYAAGEHASNLTRQLLLFSRKQQPRFETIDLNNVITELSKMLRRLIGEHITLELQLARELPLVQADAGMMEQVLLNLAVNARDAMRRGGRLTITTEQAVLAEPESLRNPEAQPGGFVRLSVCDTGIGIAPDILPQIFEPFFTTKESGKGTGLGLATVFGIIKQHQGWIDVESTINEGSSFRIYLPETAAETTPRPAHGGKQAVAGGSETILLVEDEISVREYAVAVLQRYGYRVLQAASGIDALEVWKWHSERIRLLVTDMVMPDDVSGLDLAERLLDEKPSLAVVCTTGYTVDSIERSLPAGVSIHILQKPYQPKVLAKAVRDALDRRSP